MPNEPKVEYDDKKLYEKAEEILKSINDPELMLDIWTLELLKKITVKEKKIHVLMTLTTPFCPYGPSLIQEIKDKLLEEFENVEVELTFEEPWKPSEDLKAYLGLP